MSEQPPAPDPLTAPRAGVAPDGARARERLNLLDQITSDAVASDYAYRSPDGPEDPRRPRVLVAALTLGLAGFLLAVGVSSRILNAPVVAEQRQALLERVTAADARQEELLADVTQLRTEVEQARAAELERTTGGARLADAIADYELVTGYVAVTGPGAVVTLADAVPDEGDPLDDLGRVLDADLQTAVNGLWEAGAEAIAVNDSRLTARSAIRSAAGAILVNFRPLRPPYVVSAIGPESMLERFVESPDADALRAVSDQFGIGFSAEAAEDLRLPAATAALPEIADVIEPEEGEGGEGQ